MPSFFITTFAAVARLPWLAADQADSSSEVPIDLGWWNLRNCQNLFSVRSLSSSSSFFFSFPPTQNADISYVNPFELTGRAIKTLNLVGILMKFSIKPCSSRWNALLLLLKQNKSSCWQMFILSSFLLHTHFHQWPCHFSREGGRKTQTDVFSFRSDHIRSYPFAKCNASRRQVESRPFTSFGIRRPVAPECQQIAMTRDSGKEKESVLTRRTE